MRCTSQKCSKSPARGRSEDAGSAGAKRVATGRSNQLIQRTAKVAGSKDPLERAADAAADAVVRGQRAPNVGVFSV